MTLGGATATATVPLLDTSQATATAQALGGATATAAVPLPGKLQPLGGATATAAVLLPGKLQPPVVATAMMSARQRQRVGLGRETVRLRMGFGKLACCNPNTQCPNPYMAAISYLCSDPRSPHLHVR